MSIAVEIAHHPAGAADRLRAASSGVLDLHLPEIRPDRQDGVVRVPVKERKMEALPKRNEKIAKKFP